MASRPAPAGRDYDLSDPLNSFVDVVRRVVLQPTAFFRGLPRQGSLFYPLVFALICIEISTVLGGLIRLTFRTEAMGGFRFWRGGYGFGEFLTDVILSPVGGAIGLFIVAGIAHLLVMVVVGAGNSGFASTFRVVSYASVTNLVNWIPLIGGLLALYGLYLAIVGIREVHDTSTGRALLVVLLPVILIVVLVVVLGLGLIFTSRPAP
jgi:hypothetical protein